LKKRRSSSRVRLVPLEVVYATSAKLWITPQVREKLTSGRWGLRADNFRIVKRRPRAYGLEKFQALIESGDPDRMVA